MSIKTNNATSARLLVAAEKLLSDKGFYGTSIRDVAGCLSIAKSSLLHHFASKEKLYAAVLQKIAAEMVREVALIKQKHHDEREQIIRFVELLCRNSLEKKNRDFIILREMLDNPQRAGKAKTWYFGQYLDELTAIIKSGQRKGIFKPLKPEVFILQLLGAHHYLVVSLPTVEKLFDPAVFKQILSDHREELKRFVEHRLFNENNQG